MKTLVVDDTNIKKVIRISDLINPHFKRMWTTDKPYIVANGGRGSFKSSVISLKLVTMVKKAIMQHHKANVIAVLANKSDLHDTVYNQIQWALSMLDMDNEFIALNRHSRYSISELAARSIFMAPIIRTSSSQTLWAM